MDEEILAKIADIRKGASPSAVLALVVRTGSNVPRRAGARMLVHADGAITGTIGGGAVEHLVIRRAREMLKAGESTCLETFDLGTPEGEGIDTGMICGGEMLVFMERIESSARLIIYGGGHIAAELAPLAARCGFSVTVVDDRKDVATREKFPPEIEIAWAHPVEHAGKFPLNSEDAVVVVTHNHTYDAGVLEKLLQQSIFPRYVGMIGSKKKIAATREKLAKKGIEVSRIQRLHAPIGLDIGADTPAELAVSILSEIMAVRHGKLEDGFVSSMRRRASQGSAQK